MKKIFLSLALILVTFIITGAFPVKIKALTSYTTDQVSQHNTATDCWMVIDQNVYNLTNYLNQHDQQLNIRSWCGKDATTDYNNKYNRGQSHSSRADSLLSQYLIGTFISGNKINPNPSPTATNSNLIANTDKPISGSGKYNLFLPLLGTILAYLSSLKILPRQTHHLIWNSLMLIGLIPSFIFGIILILSRQYAWPNNLGGIDLLYNHVELSIAFGTICILHFLFRLKVYLAQITWINKE